MHEIQLVTTYLSVAWLAITNSNSAFKAKGYKESISAYNSIPASQNYWYNCCKSNLMNNVRVIWINIFDKILNDCNNKFENEEITRPKLVSGSAAIIYWYLMNGRGQLRDWQIKILLDGLIDR